MRYQVEFDGEAVAVFERLSWAKLWANEYYEEVLEKREVIDGLPLAIVIVDVITDNVLETWGE